MELVLKGQEVFPEEERVYSAEKHWCCFLLHWAQSLRCSQRLPTISGVAEVRRPVVLAILPCRVAHWVLKEAPDDQLSLVCRGPRVVSKLCPIVLLYLFLHFQRRRFGSVVLGKIGLARGRLCQVGVVLILRSTGVMIPVGRREYRGLRKLREKF